MGKILEQSIPDDPENNFLGNIPHLALITLLCIKGGVTFSETEEKCLRSSPLTLTGVLKAPVQVEEVERTRKSKRETSELQGEAIPTVEKTLETEERVVGGLKITQSNQCFHLGLKKIQYLLRAERASRTT